MADVIQNAQQDFWRSPSALEPGVDASLPLTALPIPNTCAGCGSEFMIQARFCHTCGRRRSPVAAVEGSPVINGFRTRSLLWFGTTSNSAVTAWRKISLPAWLRYLHFHEIKHRVGLPTAALVAFMIGMGCVAGALGVSFFYKASNLAEFQAIQMWRIEWLLGATASFVAGILLKNTSNNG